MCPILPDSARVPGPADACDLDLLEDKLGGLRALWQRYGDCYRVASASRGFDTYVINSPASVQRVLMSNHGNYTKGTGIERVRVLLGNGLMTSEGSVWRRQRRMLQGGFQLSCIDRYCSIHLRLAQELAQRWQAAAHSGAVVDVSAAASETSLRAMLEAVFSEDTDRLDASGATLFALLGGESKRDLQFAVNLRAFGNQIRSLAGQRRRQQRFPPDLMSHCLLARDRQSGTVMSDHQLVDEVLTLIVAGHETTAAALTWLWYLLARHPEVYQRVAAEARAQPDCTSGWKQLQRLVWIPRAIKECLRLYPPGWLYTRRALGGDRLGDFPVAAHADVFICSYLLHRHPLWWPQAESFRPQRFAPEQEAGRHPCAYLPFSAGPRRCIGERFAMSEMMIHLLVIAAAVRPVQVSGASLEPEAQINLRPRQPLLLRFQATG